MHFELEQDIRNRAAARRAAGAVNWDAEMRANGLKAVQWSDAPRPDAGLVRGHGGAGMVLTTRLAPLGSQSFDAGTNTVEIVWSTGAGVLRQNYDGPFLEVLDMAASSVRLGRLNAGAPFLDSHSSYDLGDVIGSIVPGSARVAGGKGTCRVLLSDSADCADILAKVKSGVIRNVSVGYLIHGTQWSEGKDGARTCRVTDWEPIEISAVAVPADPGAQIRATG